MSARPSLLIKAACCRQDCTWHLLQCSPSTHAGQGRPNLSVHRQQVSTTCFQLEVSQVSGCFHAAGSPTARRKCQQHALSWKFPSDRLLVCCGLPTAHLSPGSALVSGCFHVAGLPTVHLSAGIALVSRLLCVAGLPTARVSAGSFLVSGWLCVAGLPMARRSAGSRTGWTACSR